MARRILLLITDLEIGGTPTVVRELARRLNDPAGGVGVEVGCLAKWGPVADQLRDAGVRVTALEARGPRDAVRMVRRLAGLVRDREIDTVFSFLVHANFVAALASRRLRGVRFFQSIQTVQPEPRWHWRVQRWIARYAERIVVPSSAVAAFARERSAIPAEKLVVIPNAVEPEAFPRVEVFADPSRVRAGYLGRLDPHKSPHDLLRSLSFAAMPGAELHYFGDGPARVQLEPPYPAMPELNGRVFLHGAVARPQEALRQMDVLWLPSRIEGFGLVLIEAMASGVPVVAYDGGGVRDIVRDGENGLLADDPALGYRRFAAALWRLRDDAELRARLIENGLRTVREKFTWDAVLPRYRAVLGVTRDRSV